MTRQAISELEARRTRTVARVVALATVARAGYFTSVCLGSTKTMDAWPR